MASLIDLWQREQDYEQGIQLLELYQPSHPLLPQLRKGVSAINKLYLHQALTSLPVTDIAAIRPKAEAPQVEEVRWAFRRLKELYIKKAKRRNQYFDKQTVEERKAINRDLIVYRREINVLMRQIDRYQASGELPTIPAVPTEIEIESSDLAELENDLRNLRSRISKKRAAITRETNGKARKTRLAKLEQDLTNLIAEKEAYEQRINEVRTSQSK